MKPQVRRWVVLAGVVAAAERLSEWLRKDPDAQRYFQVHHSGIDTLDKVNARELELGASAMALLAYLVSEEGLSR